MTSFLVDAPGTIALEAKDKQAIGFFLQNNQPNTIHTKQRKYKRMQHVLSFSCKLAIHQLPECIRSHPLLAKAGRVEKTRNHVY